MSIAPEIKAAIPQKIEIMNNFDVNSPQVSFILYSFCKFYTWRNGRRYNKMFIPVFYKIFANNMLCFFLITLAVYWISQKAWCLVWGALALMMVAAVNYIQYLKAKRVSKYPIMTIRKSVLSLHRRAHCYFFPQKHKVLQIDLKEVEYFLVLFVPVVYFHGHPWCCLNRKNWQVLFAVGKDLSVICLMIACQSQKFYHSLANITGKKIEKIRRFRE